MLASAVLVGVLAGLMTGGRLARLADLHIAWVPLLVLALAARVFAPTFGESLPAWLLGFSAIVAVAVANRRIPGMWAIAAGAGLNLLVVVVNGAMPVDPAAAAAAGSSIPADGLHRELRAGDLLTFLADRLPVPPIGGVYSLGDVVLAAGAFWVPFAWMRRR